MTTMTTEARVIQLLARMVNRPADQLSPTTHIAQDLGLDSVDLLGLVTGLEEEFDVVFPADDNLIANVKTVRDLVALVDEYRDA
jgi:acyl carrier protein